MVKTERSMPMPRRGTNVYKRKDGRWEGRVRKAGGIKGKRKYISVYGKSYQEAREKTEILRQEIKKGISDNIGAITIGEAADMWILDKASYWKPSTYAAYQNMLAKYIIPYLGKYKVTQINNQVMHDFMVQIQTKSDGSVLSNNYLHSICTILIMLLSHIKKKYVCDFSIPDNPVLMNRQKPLILPGEKSLILLEDYLLKRTDDDTCLGILVAFHTGIRIGELCALTWDDIDLKEEVIHINKNIQRVSNRQEKEHGTEILFQQPKTNTSFRDIPIPPILLPYINAYESKKGYLVKGKKSAWAEPRTLQYRFEKILKECNIQPFHFHMLRHCFATRCIDRGFDIKSLSEILGHSNVQITLNLYVHSSMLRKKQLMSLFVCPLSEEGNKDKTKF